MREGRGIGTRRFKVVHMIDIVSSGLSSSPDRMTISCGGWGETEGSASVHAITQRWGQQAQQLKVMHMIDIVSSGLGSSSDRMTICCYKQ